MGGRISPESVDGLPRNTHLSMKFPDYADYPLFIVVLLQETLRGEVIAKGDVTSRLFTL